MSELYEKREALKQIEDELQQLTLKREVISKARKELRREIGLLVAREMMENKPQRSGSRRDTAMRAMRIANMKKTLSTREIMHALGRSKTVVNTLARRGKSLMDAR
jgi:hypothetical protein